MTDEEYGELWATVKTAQTTCAQISGDVRCLRATVEAMAQQQRLILERLGCDLSTADVAFAKTREDILRKESLRSDELGRMFVQKNLDRLRAQEPEP